MKTMALSLAVLSSALVGGPILAQTAPPADLVGAGDWRGSGLTMTRNDGPRGPSAFGAGTSDRVAVDAGYRVWRDWGVGGRIATVPRQALGTGPVGMAPLRDDSYTLGIWKAGTWLTGDRLSLSVGQGTRDDVLGLGAAAMATGFGAGMREVPPVGLRATREVSTELLYTTPITKSAGLGFSLLNRTRSGLDGPLPDERVMSVRFSTRF